ncbi:MAG: hypothetical protein ACJ77D_13320 [Chloroflexota bacterium]
MAQEKRALSDYSNRLLDALRRMRDTEKRKREEPISSPKFHALAHDVDKASQEVFRLARDEERLGDAAPRGPETINDVDKDARAADTKQN